MKKITILALAVLAAAVVASCSKHSHDDDDSDESRSSVASEKVSGDFNALAYKFQANPASLSSQEWEQVLTTGISSTDFLIDEMKNILRMDPSRRLEAYVEMMEDSSMFEESSKASRMLDYAKDYDIFNIRRDARFAEYKDKERVAEDMSDEIYSSFSVDDREFFDKTIFSSFARVKEWYDNINWGPGEGGAACDSVAVAKPVEEVVSVSAASSADAPEASWAEEGETYDMPA